jgi:hypothetical protein
MRPHRLLAVVTVILSLSGEVAVAAEVSGQQLLSLCSARQDGSDNSLEAAECTGFVSGVANSFDCDEANHGFTWKSDTTFTHPQLVLIVVDWLHRHPDAVSTDGSQVVGAALQDAFPCK